MWMCSHCLSLGEEVEIIFTFKKYFIYVYTTSVISICHFYLQKKSYVYFKRDTDRPRLIIFQSFRFRHLFNQVESSVKGVETTELERKCGVIAFFFFTDFLYLEQF